MHSTRQHTDMARYAAAATLSPVWLAAKPTAQHPEPTPYDRHRADWTAAAVAQEGRRRAVA